MGVRGEMIRELREQHQCDDDPAAYVAYTSVTIRLDDRNVSGFGFRARRVKISANAELGRSSVYSAFTSISPPAGRALSTVLTARGAALTAPGRDATGTPGQTNEVCPVERRV
jgi:hypothetical protein